MRKKFLPASEEWYRTYGIWPGGSTRVEGTDPVTEDSGGQSGPEIGNTL